MGASRPGTFAAIVLVVALALALGSTAVLAPEADAVVSLSTLTHVEGSVALSHDGFAFTPAHEADVVAAGDTIRTATGASAEITYFEGSSVRLEADTQIVVESLRTETDGGTVIGIMQTLGRTWHVVTKLISGSSRYEVRTPTSTASVRGTIFAVDVHADADGLAATVTTSEGVVIHTAVGPSLASTTAVRVGAGQESTKSASRPAKPVGVAAPATLREAPARPASPRSMKTHAPSADRVEVRTNSRLGDPARAIAQPKDRATKSKHEARRER